MGIRVAITTASRAAGIAGAAVLCLLAAPGAASAAPPVNPSDGQIAAAQSAKDAAAAEVGQITAQIAQAQAKVSDTEAAANIALGTFQHTQDDYAAAQDAAAKAQEAATKAQQDENVAIQQVADFAHNAYMQGTTSPGITALLSSDGPSQMLERAALLDAAGTHRTDVLGVMVAAQQKTTAANDAAKAAVTKVADLKQKASDQLNAASALEQQARQAAKDLQTQQTDLQGKLQAAQQTLYGLQGARAAAIAYQKQQAEAAAKAAAAAQAAAASRAAAANASASHSSTASSSGSSAGSPSGSGHTATPVATTTSRGDTSAAQTAINAAKRWLGTSYAWGGGTLTGPGPGFGIDYGVTGFDCSGLTRYAYAQAGIILPRVSASQYDAYPKVTNLQPGDLVFWATDTSDPSTIHHVAMYIGGGQVIQAPESGDHVKISTMWYGSEYIGAVRPTA